MHTSFDSVRMLIPVVPAAGAAGPRQYVLVELQGSLEPKKANGGPGLCVGELIVKEEVRDI